MSDTNVTPILESIASYYAEKRKLMEELDDEVQALAERMKAELSKLGLATYEHDAGTFTMQTRKALKFRDYEEIVLKRMGDEIKAKKDEFQKLGLCEEIESKSLRFQAVKE